jgi:ABC-type multidrug transport system fused ATPase/permease subunit
MRCRCWAAAAAALLGVAAAVRDDDASAAVGLTLEWSDISYAVPGTRVNGGGRKGRGSRREKILDSVSGRARPARLLAILGSSGCGKSSLLNAIAGTIDNGKVSSPSCVS